MSSPIRYPCTPKRPTAPRNVYCATTPSPSIYQRSRIRSRVSSSPLNDATPIPASRRIVKSDNLVLSDSGESMLQRTEDPLKSMIKERFRARCLERAAKAREEQVRRRRYASGHPPSEASSDEFNEAMDEDEEDDDTIMQDELFRRIIENGHRKRQHAYRVSYALEVGSSFDPDMEDVTQWEEELGCIPPISSSGESLLSEDMLPPDFEDEDEVAAYAEDLAVIADMPEEDLFSWSDFEDGDGAASPSPGQGCGQIEDDDEMCVN
ncbi:hypothetical protein APHAL10511_002913 [Amanita phalloides]|nr:hypothetical protein APHAL10511_002913 [Amanita phalloides]